MIIYIVLEECCNGQMDVTKVLYVSAKNLSIVM